MSKYVLGFDPDSAGVPMAVYEDGKLIDLKTTNLIDLYQLCVKALADGYEVEFHIENLKGNRCSSFNWKSNDTKRVRAKKSEAVGMCKQAQTEIENIADMLNIKIVKYKVSNSWKSQQGKIQFQRVTGWKKSGNEDTRSAAYFGWLGCK